MKATLRLYQPYPLQLRFHTLCTSKRFTVAAWGRQMGKSTAALNHLLKCAWENPGTRYWFISPTYDQAKQQYRRLASMLHSCREVMLKNNQTELRVFLMNGSEIVFKSGDAPDNLRGVSLHGVVIDEVRDQAPDLWKLVIRPMLTTTRGWAIFISTPNGFDEFWELYEIARTDKTGEWGYMHASAYECPLYSKDELDSLKNMMTEAEFAQEILAEFRDMTAGRVYYAYGMHNERSDSPFAPGLEYSKHLPILVGMDFNVNPMAWTMGQTLNKQFHWSEEIYLNNSNTQEASGVLVERVNVSGVPKDKVGVILCGDASGKALNTKSANKSDYDIVKQALSRAGIKWADKTPEANPSIRDRVNAMNASLRSASGAVSTTLNPDKCPMLKRDFQRVLWKVNSDNALLDPGPKRDRTHASDGVGYPTHVYAPVKFGAPGKMRVIHRA